MGLFNWLRSKRSKRGGDNPLVAAFQKGKCPDCGGEEFHMGPGAGGMTRNVKCVSCEHWFNITDPQDAGQVLGIFFAERINPTVR